LRGVLRNKWIRVLEKNMRQLFSFICIIIIILYSCRLGLINYNLMKQVLRGNTKRTWGTTIVLHGVTSLHFFYFLKISIYHIQTIPNTWSLKKNPGILVSANWWKKETILKLIIRSLIKTLWMSKNYISTYFSLFNVLS
jgi:hypothetical protein